MKDSIILKNRRGLIGSDVVHLAEYSVSLGIRITRTNNPDVVVREAAMELWIFILRHVARDAVFCTHRTGRWSVVLFIVGDVSEGSGGRSAMASNAFRVIRGCIVHERLMRIMTCDARDARVGPAPASAL